MGQPEAAVHPSVSEAWDVARTAIPPVHDDSQSQLPAAPYPATGDLIVGVQDAMREVAVKPNEAVGARAGEVSVQGRRNAGWVSRVGLLGGDGQSTAPDAVEEKDGGEPRVPKSSAAQDEFFVAVSVEIDTDVVCLHSRQPPFNAPHPLSGDECPEKDGRLLDDRGRKAKVEPERRLVSLS